MMTNARHSARAGGGDALNRFGARLRTVVETVRRLQEWVPPGHLAHHVSDVVDALDLTAFYAPYEGDGRRNAPYEPSMMVKVLIYAYAATSRQLVALDDRLYRDIGVSPLDAYREAQKPFWRA